jgi:hypothetical protein
MPCGKLFSVCKGWHWTTPGTSGGLQSLAGFWMTENTLDASENVKLSRHLTQLSEAPTLLELSTLYDTSALSINNLRV